MKPKSADEDFSRAFEAGATSCTIFDLHAAERAFTDDELTEIRRRHDEPFDPAPDDEVTAFFARLRG